MALIQAETGVAVVNQAFHVVSKEMQLPDISTWTTEERATKHDESKGAVPRGMLDAYERFGKRTGETWDPKVAKPDHVAKYCDDHPNMSSLVKVQKVAEKAADWGGERDPLDVLGDGGNAFDIAFGNDDSFAKVGYPGSEFITWEPPVPEATAKAFTDEIKISVVNVNNVVFPAFSRLIRWLEANTVIPLLDKADEAKEDRKQLILGEKDGGYGAVKEVESAEGAEVLIADGGGTMVVWKGVVDRCHG